MDVTDVLRDRMHEPGGLERMATLSVVAHGAIIALVLFAPGRWGTRQAAPPAAAMTIVLGGTSGPQTTGMTTMGGRPVQQATPPEEAPKREVVRPPAAKTPEMTLPAPKAKPLKTAPPNVKQAPEEARGPVA